MKVVERSMIIIVAAACLLTLNHSGIMSSLLLFFLIGIVPGTTYVVPANIMLACTVFLIITVVVAFGSLPAMRRRTTTGHSLTEPSAYSKV